MKNPEILIGTGNKGKLGEMGTVIESAGFKWVSPEAAGMKINPDETGETLEENARLKAAAFRAEEPDKYVIIVDDSGLEIDALDREPGIKIRRWRDGETEMTDQEIVDYALERMHGVPSEKRGAQFRSVVALDLPDGTIELFEGILRGRVLEAQEGEPPKGFPFRCLFIVDTTGKMLGEHDGDAGQTHREQAVAEAMDWLKRR